MTGFDDFTMSLLNNRDLIDVLWHTHSAHPLFRKKTDTAETTAWLSTYENGDFCVALFNLGETNASVTATVPFGTSFTVTNLWTKQLSDTTDGSVTATLAPHACAMYRFSCRK